MAVKPTSSISRPQDSVNLGTGEPEVLEVHGRHDPCIAPRAVPVAEAVCALSLLDAWLSFPPEGDPFTLGTN
jgi:chorismate synthase